MTAEFRTFTEHPDYSKFPVYSGNDLGVQYSKQATQFRIWSPVAQEVVVRIYKDDYTDAAHLHENLIRDVEGTWSLQLKGDFRNMYYTFQVRSNNNWNAETPGMCAKALGANSVRGVIVDMADTHPPEWNNDKSPDFEQITDSVIYELHIRDLSTHPDSGITNKGKFLGLCETGTKNADGLSTGLDHIVELGVTHIHLLPVFDFMSVDEAHPEKKEYNWGYDPQNYNVPEGSYATDPHSGVARIREFKQMVQALHNSGLRVVMDVVYNHTGRTLDSSFNLIMPGYFYRHNWDGSYSNASGCGNETASERPMTRKFIFESIKYWAEEYHIDGFRFDLMGIHDIDTINYITTEMLKINPSLIFYGEGWTAGDSPLPFHERALKQHIRHIQNMAVFNDNIRDAVKGPWWNEHEGGFVNGRWGYKEHIKQGIVGAVGHSQVNYDHINHHNEAWAASPQQSINYVSCHDNYTLWDKLKLSGAGIQRYELVKMHKLCLAIVLTSQGVPFLHAGSEILRSKGGHGNSYNSPDEVNQINWTRKSKYKFVSDYVAGLIKLRKDHPAFRMTSSDQINKHLRFIDTPHPCCIAYELAENANGDRWKRIIVILNGSNEYTTVTIAEGHWVVVANDDLVNQRGINNMAGGRIRIAPISAMILVGH